MIQAIILEIEHSKITSLGVELATNPGAFGTLSENAITALANIAIDVEGGDAQACGHGVSPLNWGGSGVRTRPREDGC